METKHALTAETAARFAEIALGHVRLTRSVMLNAIQHPPPLPA